MATMLTFMQTLAKGFGFGDQDSSAMDFEAEEDEPFVGFLWRLFACLA
jgi:hypothetical protein